MVGANCGRGSLGQHLGEDLRNDATKVVGVVLDGALDLLALSGQVACGAGDDGDADGRSVPNEALVELGHGDVEAVAELVFDGADGVAAFLEGVRFGDF